MRYSEIANLGKSDITFHNTFMELFVEKCKTDIYCEGNWIHMIKSTRNLCPVKILQNCFNFSLINDKLDEYIFRAITKTKITEKLRNVNKSLLYTRTRELLLEALVDVGWRKEDFRLHGLLSGAAILAANKGVKDCLFKRHGVDGN